MRNLFLATSLLAVPTVAFAGGPTCAIPPSPTEAAATHTAENQADTSVPVLPPVNPQAQARL